LLLALTPDRIAFQDLGALFARRPAVAERWHRHLIASPFGAIQVAAFSLPTPLGTAMPRPPIYTLANLDPTNIARSIAEQPLRYATASQPFPQANRQAKADLMITRTREPMPPLPPLLAFKPTSKANTVATMDGIAGRFLHVSPTSAVFNAPVLAPVAFIHFCNRYPEDCKIQSNDFDQAPVHLTQARLAELSKINREVNNSIKPQANLEGDLAEGWLVAPRHGDCTDYAVTKRHALLARGWPSRSLLLAEVIVDSGEHHLVLVVRTRDGDLVLDNLNSDVRPVSQINYQWVRAQKTENPRFWSTINVGRIDRVAMRAP
jgi:predicted transglutaminase-like cysteine proteinase